ncbi:hypothetical protein K2Q00_03420 [Patescibacteria group bacterium]|nr:hypothetical protein [Patescibacteria group bacterium]
MELLEQGQKIKLGVSGAAETGHCGIDAYEKGMELGRQIAAQGAILLTGATTGFPMWSAMGTKEANGISIGVSPANSEKEHIETYNLPLEYMDLILYTGFGFPGRDIIFTHSSDGMLFGCGRIGTVHEFTVAFEDGKPIGILEGSWDTDEVIKDILANGHRPNDNIVFDSDPKILVEKVLELVKKNRAARSATHIPVTAQV